jgi:hypothetical protein
VGRQAQAREAGGLVWLGGLDASLDGVLDLLDPLTSVLDLFGPRGIRASGMSGLRRLRA